MLFEKCFNGRHYFLAISEKNICKVNDGFGILDKILGSW